MGLDDTQLHKDMEDEMKIPHQGSRRIELTRDSDQKERRKNGPDQINLHTFVSDNVDYHINSLVERRRVLLLELNETNAQLVRLHTLRDVTGP